MDTKAIYDELSEETQEWVRKRVTIMRDNYAIRYKQMGNVARGTFGEGAGLETLLGVLRYLDKLKEKER